MDSSEFTDASALDAAKALSDILEARVHRRKYMGQIVTVPGQLGDALKLPKIINQLQSKIEKRRIAGLERFVELWDSLSEGTRRAVLNQIGWYDPRDLDWEDKRSNRRPG